MNREQAKVYAGLTKEQLETIKKVGYAIHLDVIRKFAEGAEVEWRHISKTEWTRSHDNPSFFDTFEYRVKKPTHWVNGFEVPAPDVNADASPTPISVYAPDVVGVAYYVKVYQGGDYYPRSLERGIAFSNKEDAIANAKAMLGIDP